MRRFALLLCWCAYFTAGSVFFVDWFHSKGVTEYGWLQVRPYFDWIGIDLWPVYLGSALLGSLLMGYLLFKGAITPMRAVLLLVSALVATTVAEVVHGRPDWRGESMNWLSELAWFSHEVVLIGGLTALCWFLMWDGATFEARRQAALRSVESR